jgi:hypothetical protein
MRHTTGKDNSPAFLCRPADIKIDQNSKLFERKKKKKTLTAYHNSFDV